MNPFTLLLVGWEILGPLCYIGPHETALGKYHKERQGIYHCHEYQKLWVEDMKGGRFVWKETKVWYPEKGT